MCRKFRGLVDMVTNTSVVALSTYLTWYTVKCWYKLSEVCFDDFCRSYHNATDPCGCAYSQGKGDCCPSGKKWLPNRELEYNKEKYDLCMEYMDNFEREKVGYDDREFYVACIQYVSKQNAKHKRPVPEYNRTDYLTSESYIYNYERGVAGSDDKLVYDYSKAYVDDHKEAHIENYKKNKAQEDSRT